MTIEKRWIHFACFSEPQMNLIAWFGSIRSDGVLHNSTAATFLLLWIFFCCCEKNRICSFLSGSRYPLIIYNLPLIFLCSISLWHFESLWWSHDCSRFSHTFAHLRVVAYMQIRRQTKMKNHAVSLCYCCGCQILSFRLHQEFKHLSPFEHRKHRSRVAYLIIFESRTLTYVVSIWFILFTSLNRDDKATISTASNKAKPSKANQPHVNVFILHDERMWGHCIRLLRIALRSNRSNRWNKSEIRISELCVCMRANERKQSPREKKRTF